MCIPKSLKQRRQPLPLPLAKSKVLRAENVTWLRRLVAIEYAYPAHGVTKRFVDRSP